MSLVLVVLFSITIGLIAIPIIRKLSHKRGWYDSTDHRKTHIGAIPRLGGLGIAIALLSGLFFAYILGILPVLDQNGLVNFLLFLGGILVGHLVGLFDDFRNLPAFVKLIFQIIGAIFIAISGVTVDSITIPFTDITIQFGVFAFPITVLWIIAVSNAINLIDGVDGFAASTTLVCAVFLALLHGGNTTGLVFSLLLIGSVFSFLVYNKPKASIFMGDGGAYLLGFVLAALPFIPSNFDSIKSIGERITEMPHIISGSISIDVLGVILIFALPLGDMAYAIMRRWSRGLPMHVPDRSHIHHKLTDLGLKPWSLLGVLNLANVIFGLFGFLYIYLQSTTTISPLIKGLLLICGFIAVILYFALIRQKFKHRVVMDEKQ